MVMASVAGVALLSVFANSTAAALGDADYREAAVITFVVTASGVTVFGLGGAVWGLLAGGGGAGGEGFAEGPQPLKRFAKNLTHRISRNAVLRSIVARVPPLADASG
jgi:hypothetical protein